MKKVLIITYYWPPSGGGGVQRWLKFTKYLPDFGWEPIIFTPENPFFELEDESLLKDVSDDLEVIKLPIWEPYRIFEKLTGKKTPAQGITNSNHSVLFLGNIATWIRGNFFIPDPRRFWAKPAIKFLSEIIESNNINTVITTGPPHSMHLIGLGLKKKLGIRWVADFRDPWSQWDMLDHFKLSSFAWNRHKKLELKTLKYADEVITVSDSWANEFKSIYNRNYHVITNGFDSGDLMNISAESTNDKMVISHFGLLNSFRNPQVLWEVLKKYSNRVSVNLTGTIASELTDQFNSDSTLRELLNINRPIPHQEMRKAYQNSDILLLILNESKNANGHLPGKLFEYFATGKPILAIGPKNSDAAKIINTTNSGIVVDSTDESGMISAIDKLLNNDLQPVQSEIQKYSRKNLTQQLVEEVLNQ